MIQERGGQIANGRAVHGPDLMYHSFRQTTYKREQLQQLRQMLQHIWRHILERVSAEIPEDAVNSVACDVFDYAQLLHVRHIGKHGWVQVCDGTPRYLPASHSMTPCTEWNGIIIHVCHFGEICKGAGLDGRERLVVQYPTAAKYDEIRSC